MKLYQKLLKLHRKYPGTAHSFSSSARMVKFTRCCKYNLWANATNEAFHVFFVVIPVRFICSSCKGIYIAHIFMHITVVGIWPNGKFVENWLNSYTHNMPINIGAAENKFSESWLYNFHRYIRWLEKWSRSVNKTPTAFINIACIPQNRCNNIRHTL